MGPLAQRLEQGTHNALAVGSNPTRPTIVNINKGQIKMTKLKWNDKDENGNYIHFLMQHEVEYHGRTEEEAVKILTKYFGFEPKIEFKKVHN